MARLDELLNPEDLGGGDSSEALIAEAAIERVSKFLNRSDFESAPASLRLACQVLAEHLAGASERATAGVVTRETSDDVSVWLDTSGTQTDSSGLTPEVKSLVAGYRFTPGL